MSATLSDEDVVERIRAGDRESYGLLAMRHHQRLERLAQRFVRDPADAEDAVQGAHLLAFSRFDQYQGRAPYVQWMASITVNQVRAGYRQNRLSAASEELQDCHSDPRPSPEQSVMDQELQGILKCALEGIPPAYSLVFRLREVSNLSTAETSRRLGLSNACVKSRLLRARSMLRRRIETQLGSRKLRRSSRGPVALRDSGEP
jgi:RNA polymerase sigma-70 factor (ECF subfamily)